MDAPVFGNKESARLVRLGRKDKRTRPRAKAVWKMIFTVFFIGNNYGGS